MKQQLSKFVGIYRIMSEWHVCATLAVIFFIAYVPILVLRAVVEGIPYQVSYAALFGDPGLVIAFTIVATMFRENRVTRIPEWFQKRSTHFLIYVWSFLLMVFVSTTTMKSRSGQLADWYHDLVVASLFVYMGITLAPIVWFNGTKGEKRAVWGFVALLLILGVVDILLKDLNQPQWLLTHGLQAIERMR